MSDRRCIAERQPIRLSFFGFVLRCFRAIFLPTTFFAVLGVAYVGKGWVSEPPDFQAAAAGAAGLLLLWFVGGLAWTWLAFQRTRWERTTEELIQTEGYWNRERNYMDLRRILDTQVDSPFPYSLLNCG
jgi:hypothetical protein